METRAIKTSPSERYPIQPINCLIGCFKSLWMGDILYLGIDGTLIAVNDGHAEDTVLETEKELGEEIRRLMESGISVYGLTARDANLAEVTNKQLESLGIRFDGVLHASNERTDAGKRSTKGEVLLTHFASFVATPRRRVVMIDNDSVQLEAVRAALSQQQIPSQLYHYTRAKRLHINAADYFPEDLSDYHLGMSLGGGTQSTYLLKTKDPSKPALVLKFGVHADAIKMEVLSNALYQCMGVSVPVFEAYRELPMKLAKQLDLQTRHGIFQISRYIEPIQSSHTKIKATIKATAQKDFIAYVLLGNIDVVKEDQFVVDANGNVYMVDAGANYIFHARGENRAGEADRLEEFKNLRDPVINQRGHAWFAGLSDAALKEQARAIFTRINALEETIWDVSGRLGIADDQRQQFITTFAQRLETLAYRVKLADELAARVEKEASYNTAAGILTYSMIDGRPHVLLSKRVRHCWWDNFGGKSDAGDMTLLRTAQREVREESGGVFDYNSAILAQSPFHDLISKRDGEPYVYRMYLVAHDPVDLRRITDHEHTDHQWVAVADLTQAMHQPTVVAEGKRTCQVTVGDRNLILFPPLYAMLQQAPVLAQLERLAAGRGLVKTHTQGHVGVKTTPGVKRAFATPEQMKLKLSGVFLTHSHVLRELKSKQSMVISDPHQEKNNAVALSQSELHMKAVLGKDYQIGNVRANVVTMLDKHDNFDMPADPVASKRIIDQLVSWIGREKSGGSEHVYFYHGCNAKIAYAYEVYSKLYEVLKVSNKESIFRAQGHHFKKLANIQAFIAHYSGHGKHEIDNNALGYSDFALCANVFLFGNHKSSTSASLSYMLNNETRRGIDLKALLQDVLNPFCVSEEWIDQMILLYQSKARDRQGALYQIALPRKAASELSYASGHLGVLNPYGGTHNIVEVLNKLQSASAITDSDTQYIQKLQARLMLPPMANSQVVMLHKQAWGEQKQKSYEQALSTVIDRVVLDMLRHVTLRSSAHLHDHLPLLRQMRWALKANQVPDLNDHEELERLAKAMIGNDDADVIEKLNRFPQWKEVTLKYPGKISYIKSYDGDKSQHPAKPVIWFMLYYTKLKPDTYVACFGEQWWERLIIEGVRQLCIVLNRLDTKGCLGFATANKDKIKDGYELGLVLERLDAQDRLDFATANKDKIKDGGELGSVLNQLNAQDRLDFATANIDKIKDGDELGRVLERLDAQDRLDFATANKDKIKNGAELGRVLERLDAQDRLDFATANKDKIKNGAELGRVLARLNAQDRLGFATANKDKIKDGDELGLVLERLDTKDCLGFAIVHQDKIKDGDELGWVLNLLDTKDCLGFAIVHQDKIKDCDELGDVLNRLDAQHRLGFATANKDKIKDGGELGWVLDQLNAQHRLGFATANKDKIKNGAELGRVLERLDAQDRLGFATANKDKIKNGAELGSVLNRLDAQHRLGFATAQQVKIKHGAELGWVLDQLNAQDRLGFATAHQDKIKDGDVNRIIEKTNTNVCPRLKF